LFVPADALLLPQATRERIARLPDLLARQASTLLVRGVPGSERRAVAGAVARALGKDLMEAAAPDAAAQRLLGPLCTATGALPLQLVDLAPGETADAPLLPGYRGPQIYALGLEGGLRGPAAERAVTLTLPLLASSDRRRCWHAALGPDTDPALLDELADRFHLPGGAIARAAPIAQAEAVLNGRTAVTLADARIGCRAVGRQQLDALAEHLQAQGSWDELVVSRACRAQLRELEARCRHRERLTERLRPAFGSAGRGVRALFSGPSGTGKTLAARVLAAELGLDLYRVDLAAVVNKYIGETEKNLHRVLSVAEAMGVVLLLDEGDALLGARTGVRNANDRYANLETNYLLQRLEHYRGIVLVTTNLGENIDRAFQRRMDVSVAFDPPEPAERLAIWRLHLGETGNGLLADVAARCALTGGQIRNAAQLATLLALDAGADAASEQHVVQAVQREYQKSGGTSPLASGAADVPARGGLGSFLETL
jgi:hypothetical protein